MCKLPYESNSFDALFCYGALMFGNPPKALKEFARVLKPGGKLYVCVNTLEWYFLMPKRFGYSRHHIKMATRVILNHYLGWEKSVMVMNEKRLKMLAERSGLIPIVVSAEGTISVNNMGLPIPVFYPERWRGKPAIIEALLEKEA